MNPRLEIRIPAELKHRLSLEAARDNRSMAGVIIVALEMYLKGAAARGEK